MIINNNITGANGVYKSNSGRTVKFANAYNQSQSLGDDIQISSQGQEFYSLLQKMKSGSDVRADKVTEYENLIASGAYSVDSSALAEKILQYRY